MNSEKKQRTALICGSFDPITKGHLDIVERCVPLFDKIYLTAFINPKKDYCFTEEERLSFMKAACQHLPSVVCGFCSGMVADYVKENNIDCIVKGIRNTDDLTYEIEMAKHNKLHSGRETVFLVASSELCDCSSSLLRERLSCGESVSRLLPESICTEVLSAYKTKGDN